MAIGVQEADVWAAADALLQSGEQPTIERVRLHLGRGSPNTVGPHLKTWFRGLGERLGAGHSGMNGVPDAVTRAVNHVWETALAAARDEWSAVSTRERAELAKAKEALQIDHTALQQIRERLQTREADLQASAQAAYAQASAAETRLQAAEQQVNEATQASKALDAELVRTREQIAALQQALHQAQTSHQEALAAAEARHATHEGRWLSEIDEQRQALKKARDELSAQRKSAARDNAQQAEAAAGARQEAQKLKEALAAVQAEHARLNVQLETDRESARLAQAGLLQRQADLESRLQELRAQITVKDSQIAALTQQMIARQPATRARRPKT
ncbi:DNA-binding protein [Bordetella muralis]|uniref:DNA-binding protein n=1 Tax=Bordetella muralis TaxID=1649130 RepID=UPI0039EE6A3A